MKKILLMLTALALIGTMALAQTGPDTYVEISFGDIDTLDPVQAYDSASLQVIENVYETLYDYKGESVSEYEPLLATDYETSEDGLTYTFTLRDGVTFHSGNPFTCADAEYTFERALVTNPADSGMWFLSDSLLGTESNAKSTLGEDATDQQYADFWKKLDASVECTDDSTLVFHLDHVDPAFFAKLLFKGLGIVDKKWAIANGMWDGTQDTWRDFVGVDLRQYYLQNHMSGTGAYQLVDWQPGTQTVLEAYDNYWGGAPDIKNVVLKIVDDESARILAMQQGDADSISIRRAVLGQVEGAPGVKVMDAAEDPSLGWSTVSVGAIFMNQTIAAENNPNIGSGKLDGKGIPPDFFTDVNVRKCFNYSFDRDAYINELLQGEGTPLTMALPPSYLGYDPTIPTYNLDLEAAEEACKAAWDGQVWDKGFQLTIAYNTGNETRQASAEILKSNLEFLNPKFKVDVKGMAWPDFLQARNSGLLPLSIVSWIPDYADPDNYIHTFYASTGYYGGQMGYHFEQIDAWDAQARSETNPEVRKFLYSSIGHRAHELSLLILQPQGVPFLVLSDSLEGVYLNPMLSGNYLWKNLSKN